MRLRRQALIGILVLLGSVTAAAAQTRPDIFTVTAVPVDATAASASAARDTARLRGEHKAFEMLLDRLTLASDRGRQPHPTDAQLNDLVQSFQVADERRSTVRYLANYTFHFQPDAIRELLRRAQLPYAETRSKALLVLPVLESDAGPRLWEDPNPWRDAWGKTPLPEGLVPFVLAYGDIEDVAAIDAATAENGDDAHLQAIAKRYGDDDVLVTRVTLKGKEGQRSLELASTRFAPGHPGAEQSWVAAYQGKPGQSDADLFAAAIAGTESQVEEAWKQANVLDFNQSGTLIVAVPAHNLQSWVDVRDRLAGIPAIRRSELLSINRQGARLAIHYVGDPAQLKVALAQRDLDLAGADPDWVLQARSPTK